MNTIMSSKGQIILPAKFRRQDNIEAGQAFDVERVDKGKYRLTATTPSTNQGLVDTLLACPVKGWFTPIESESTDTLGGTPGASPYARQTDADQRQSHCRNRPHSWIPAGDQKPPGF